MRFSCWARFGWGLLFQRQCRVYAIGIAAAGLLWADLATATGIVVLRAQDLEPYNQAYTGFSEACAANVTQYTLGGNKAAQQRMAEEILESRPRLILAIGLVAARVAKDQLKDIPTLYIMVSNPKKYGLVGNNIAGIALNIPAEAQFKAYESLLPGLKTVGVIYNAENSGELIRDATATAARMGKQLVAVAVGSQKEVPEALRGMLGKVDALWMIPDDVVVTTDSFKYFLVTTLENGMPFFAASEIFVEAGALAALSPDYVDMGRQGCQLATAISEGRMGMAEAGSRPPRKLNLSLNLKTARKIGIVVPRGALESAKQVYQ